MNFYDFFINYDSKVNAWNQSVDERRRINVHCDGARLVNACAKLDGKAKNAINVYHIGVVLTKQLKHARNQMIAFAHLVLKTHFVLVIL